MTSEQTMKNEALAFVKALNETWTKGDGSALRDYPHLAAAITPTDRDILMDVTRVWLHGRTLPSP